MSETAVWDLVRMCRHSVKPEFRWRCERMEVAGREQVIAGTGEYLIGTKRHPAGMGFRRRGAKAPGKWFSVIAFNLMYLVFGDKGEKRCSTINICVVSRYRSSSHICWRPECGN